MIKPYVATLSGPEFAELLDKLCRGCTGPDSAVHHQLRHRLLTEYVALRNQAARARTRTNAIEGACIRLVRSAGPLEAIGPVRAFLLACLLPRRAANIASSIEHIANLLSAET